MTGETPEVRSDKRKPREDIDIIDSIDIIDIMNIIDNMDLIDIMDLLDIMDLREKERKEGKGERTSQPAPNL